MHKENQDRIDLARELLKNIRFVSLATVNEDGSPHNSPLFFMRDEDFTHIYWGSHQDSLHSLNIGRTHKVYAVMYDAVEYNKGGLYIIGDNAHKLEGDELVEGLRVHNSIRAKFGGKPLPISYYQKGQQAMYGADVTKLEVHVVTKDEDGRILKEVRQEVSAEDLVK